MYDATMILAIHLVVLRFMYRVRVKKRDKFNYFTPIHSKFLSDVKLAHILKYRHLFVLNITSCLIRFFDQKTRVRVSIAII
jgi:hypothetical protein